MKRACSGWRRLAWLCLAILVTLSASTGPGSAHDVPNQIVLNAFVKPEGRHLQVVLRVPLIMLASLNLPKRGPGYLDLERIEGALQRSIEATAREILFYEGPLALAHDRAVSRISQPSDRSFESYQDAIAQIEGPPLPLTEAVFWNQGYFDVHYRYPISSDRSDFALDLLLAPGLSGRLKMVVRYLPSEGPVRAYEVHAGFGRLALDPRWHQAGWTFFKFGFAHILDGIDHLLFLVALVVPFALRQFWSLVWVVTSFTLAHSITLIASALGVVPAGEWFPPLVEAMIALSILYVALENIVVALKSGQGVMILRWRWLITGLFGLVHGFGFAFALQQDLQFAGAHLLMSLLSFNLGVEAGQVLVLGLVMLGWAVVARTPALRRAGIVIVSALLAHTAWHWMIERAQSLQYVDWPALDSLSVTSVIGAAVLAGLFSAAVWLTIRQVERRRNGRRRPAE